MKVQIVRLVTGGCITFLVVFLSVYAMGKLSANRPNYDEHKNVSLTAIAGETERDSKVAPVAELKNSTPAQSDTASQPFHVDESWFQGTKEERSRFAPLLRSEDAPALSVAHWINTTQRTSQAREGKIVVLSFWSTSCKSCLSSIGFNNALYRHYRRQNVTFIGVCANEGSAGMAKIVKSKGIKYPVCSDMSTYKTIEAFKVQAVPSYFVIDSTGRLRFADLKRGRVDDAIEYLLSRE